MLTYCGLLLIKKVNGRFCGGVDCLKLIDGYIVSDRIGEPE